MKKNHPERFQTRLNLSWSNWGFGMEHLVDSAARLANAGIGWIELHGNHYGPDLGYKPSETRQILSEYGLQVAGICGMLPLSITTRPPTAPFIGRAIDYIRRELAFAREVDAVYVAFLPECSGSSYAVRSERIRAFSGYISNCSA